MPKHQSLSHKQMAANEEAKNAAVVQAVAVESVERVMNTPAVDESPLEIGDVEEVVLETPITY